MPGRHVPSAGSAVAIRIQTARVGLPLTFEREGNGAVAAATAPRAPRIPRCRCCASRRCRATAWPRRLLLHKSAFWSVGHSGDHLERPQQREQERTGARGIAMPLARRHTLRCPQFADQPSFRRSARPALVFSPKALILIALAGSAPGERQTSSWAASQNAPPKPSPTFPSMGP